MTYERVILALFCIQPQAGCI